MPKYHHGPGALPKNADRNLRYEVILYRNQRRKKLMYHSRVIYPAKEKYRELLAQPIPTFPQMWDWLGKPITYELVLLGNSGAGITKYKAPSGVVYDVAAKDGFVVKDIQPYYMEESFKFHNENRMVKFKDVIKLMIKEENTKSIMVLTNKILIQVLEEDEMYLFVFKNKADAERLYGEVEKFYYNNKLPNCFFFTGPTGWDITDLYIKICEKLKISRTQMKKISTRA